MRLPAPLAAAGVTLSLLLVFGTGCGPALPMPASIPSGVEDRAYEHALEITDGEPPFEWYLIAGQLPPGLELETDGVIEGTPTTPGEYEFTLEATDEGIRRGEKAYRISIVQKLEVSTTIPDARRDEPFSHTFTITGGLPPYTTQLIGLPAGLTFASGTATISGTPTREVTETQLRLTVTDSGAAQQTRQSETIDLFWTVQPPAVAITTTALPNGEENVAYEATLEAAEGFTPYTWSVTAGALPSGLRLNREAGTITGTPTEAGEFNVTIKVTDAGDPEASDSAVLSLTIITADEPTGPLQVATSTLTDATVEEVYQQILQAANGVEPYTWAVTEGALPDGLELDTTTGTLTGTPTAATGDEPASFTVTVNDSADPPQTASREFTLTVYIPFQITTESLPEGTVNLAYNADVKTSPGTEPIRWAVVNGVLPNGLRLNVDTGAITGTPTGAGVWPFTVQVSDSSDSPVTDTAALSITITE